MLHWCILCSINLFVIQCTYLPSNVESVDHSQPAREDSGYSEFVPSVPKRPSGNTLIIMLIHSSVC